MSYKATIYRVLISTPSDVTQELKAIPEVFSAWNAINSPKSGKYLEPVHWRSHSYLSAGDRPQSILNAQIVDDSDLLVAVFWTRLGTPTGDFASGSVEEIERFISAKKPVLVYFSSQPVVPESIDTEQYQKLIEYKTLVKEKALYAEYGSIWDFREQLSRHITKLMHGMESDASQENNDSIIRNSIEAFLEHFAEIVRRYEVDWNAEKQGQPVNTDDAKFIIERFGEELLYLRSQITEDENGMLS